MRNHVLISFVITIQLFASCKNKTRNSNYFTHQNDTLIIETKKVPGGNIFDIGASAIEFQDLCSFNHYQVIIPDGISTIKIGLRCTDWKIHRYLRYKKGEISKEFIVKDVKENKLDTTFAHSIRNSSIPIMSGIKNNKMIFIVDENNNKDFRDDSIRPYEEMNWYTPNYIKCKHLIYNGKIMVEDSSSLNIGTSRDKLLMSGYQHLTSTFTLENDTYQIGVIQNSSDFSFDEPIAALISENGIKKDSLMKSEILELGEYFKLNNQYYIFENITNDGSKIKLVREDYVNDKIGTQIGFIAPPFESLTIKNDTISSKDYENNFLLITNITSCYSPINSYECYKELYEAYNSKIKILAIDDAPSFLNFQINRLDLKGDFIIASKNKYIKENYRQDFCSRTCFLINPEGTIIDKFEIFDWKQMLSNHFK